MSRQRRISYAIMAAILVAAVWLKLGTLLIVALFSFLALSGLARVFNGRKWPAIILFFLLFAGATVAIVYFISHAVHALPQIADKAIPSILQWAKQNQIELPFTDYESLRQLAMETVKDQLQFLGAFARDAGIQVVYFIFGSVIAASLFRQSQIELDRHRQPVKNNLYSLLAEEMAERFALFYASFVRVMGAQVIISAINTAFTSIFVCTVGLPYPVVVIGVTFLCGMLPVVGNLISNTIIVAIAFTVSPKMAAFALAFLILIHKLEYFLNSKIIGARIRNPVWLTLLALVAGERLMGLQGMILAPVVLHYVKQEASRVEVSGEALTAHLPPASDAAPAVAAPGLAVTPSAQTPPPA